MAEIPAWIVPILSWGATYLLHSTLIITGIYLYSRWKKDLDHAVRESLWKTALVGGVATSLFQFLASPWPVADFHWQLGSASTSSGEVRLPSNYVSAFAVNGAPIPVKSASGSNLEIAPTTVDVSGNDVDAMMIMLDCQGELLDAAIAPRITGTASGNLNLFVESDDRHRFDADNAQFLTLALTQTDRFWSDLLQPLKQRLGAIASWVALTAILVGLARAAWQSLALRTRLSHCVPVVGGTAYDLLQELRHQVPCCPEVQLLATDEGNEPAAFGIRTWTILLPERAERELSIPELRTLLAHELAHLVRGDSLWLGFSRLVCSLLAFQPLNFLARREWQSAAEMLSDSWAVEQTGEPLALARCLTEVAGWKIAAGGAAATMAVTGSGNGLTHRIESLLTNWNSARRLVPQSTRWSPRSMCILLLAVVSLVTPRLSLTSPQTAVANPTEFFPVNKSSQPTNSPSVAEAEETWIEQWELGTAIERTMQIAEVNNRARSPEQVTVHQLVIDLEIELTALINEVNELQLLADSSAADAIVIKRVHLIRQQLLPVIEHKRVVLLQLREVHELDVPTATKQ